MAHAIHLLWAMTAMAALGVAVFYARFWRQTRDRLFAWFALAFVLMAGNWTVLAVLSPRNEPTHLLYLLRLVAFLVILGAIIGKNRGGRDHDL